MPISIPPLKDILHSLRQYVAAEVDRSDPWPVFNNLTPTLKAFAQVVRAAYLRMQFIFEQAFVTTATGEYLDYHGIQAGGLRRTEAGFAQGYLSVVATLGTVIPDETVVSRSDGQLYMIIGTTTVVVSPALVFARAVEAGEIGNTDYGATFNPLVPIAGLTSITVDTNGLIGGTEEETDDSFRQRILFHKQNPPHGGSPSEYEEWASTKIGVTRVFPQRATPGPGSATIYFMMDGIGTGVPTTTDVDEMQDILEQFAPEDAEVIAAAPTTSTINIVITDLVPDTPLMREAVIDNIKSMFLDRAEPGPGVFARDWISEAISGTPKWKRSRVTTPSGDTTMAAGVLPILGTITFV